MFFHGTSLTIEHQFSIHFLALGCFFAASARKGTLMMRTMTNCHHLKRLSSLQMLRSLIGPMVCQENLSHHRRELRF